MNEFSHQASIDNTFPSGVPVGVVVKEEHDSVEISKGPLWIRKTRIGPEEVIDEGMHSAYPIEVEIRQNKNLILISSLLPQEWRIVEAELDMHAGQCTPIDEAKDVRIAMGIWSEDDPNIFVPYLTYNSSLLTLLHEIGHAWEEVFKTEKEVAQSRQVTWSPGNQSPDDLPALLHKYVI